jgi:tape measure domain-containing protein
MSFQLAEAYVQLSNRGFSGVMSGISAIGSKLTSLVQPAALASAAIGAIGGLSVGKMFQLAGEAEALSSQFETLLGSAGAASGMVAQLKEFGAKTPFEFPGLAQTAKNLLAFGVSQEQVIPTLKVLGDIASATGQDINELGGIYGKIKAQGKLSLETVMQLQERSVPIIDTLAKSYGKTTAEMQKMISDGKVGFGDMQGALAAMTAEGGKFAGGMDRQAGTLTGLWSTLTDSIGASMTEIGAAIIDGFNLKDGIKGVTGFVETFTAYAVPMISSGIETLIEYFSGFQPYFNSMSQLFVALGGIGRSAFNTIAGAMQWYFKQVQSFYNNVAAPMISAIADVIANYDLYWQLAGAYVANFAINAWERIKTFGINIVEIIQWAGRNWYEILYDYGSLVSTVFTNVGSNIKKLWNAVLDFIAGKGFNVDFTPLTKGFRSVVQEMPQLTKANLNQLKPEIDAVYDQLDQRKKDAEREKEERNKKRPDGTGSPGSNDQAKFEIDKASQGGTAKDKKGDDKASFVGLAQLAERMQTQAGADRDRQKQTEATQASADATKQLLAKATGEGLRVSMAIAGMPPVVPIQFGEGGA